MVATWSHCCHSFKQATSLVTRNSQLVDICRFLLPILISLARRTRRRYHSVTRLRVQASLQEVILKPKYNSQPILHRKDRSAAVEQPHMYLLVVIAKDLSKSG